MPDLLTLKRLVWIMALATLTGCAADYSNLAVRSGTVTESFHSLRPVFRPSAGGAAAGAAVGGVAGNQIGKGNGRKAATAVGILAGAAAGATAAGKTEMVPYSEVTFTDNASGETFRGNLDGHWVVGMRVRFSVTPENKLVLR